MHPRTSPLLAEFRSPVSLACFLLVAIIGLAADLWTKQAAWDTLVEKDADGWPLVISIDEQNIQPIRRRDVVVVPGLLELTAVANQGAAMGLGQGQQTLFVIVSIGALFVVFYLFAVSGGKRLYQVVLGLLLAGVLGNLYDRMVFRYVRDMIHVFPGVRWSSLHPSLPDMEIFPWVFNLADVFLCVGVPVVLIYGMFANPEQEQQELVASGEDPGRQ